MAGAVGCYLSSLRDLEIAESVTHPPGSFEAGGAVSSVPYVEPTIASTACVIQRTSNRDPTLKQRGPPSPFPHMSRVGVSCQMLTPTRPYSNIPSTLAFVMFEGWKGGCRFGRKQSGFAATGNATAMAFLAPTRMPVSASAAYWPRKKTFVA